MKINTEMKRFFVALYVILTDLIICSFRFLKIAFPFFTNKELDVGSFLNLIGSYFCFNIHMFYIIHFIVVYKCSTVSTIFVSDDVVDRRKLRQN